MRGSLSGSLSVIPSTGHLLPGSSGHLDTPIAWLPPRAWRGQVGCAGRHAVAGGGREVCAGSCGPHSMSFRSDASNASHVLESSYLGSVHHLSCLGQPLQRCNSQCCFFGFCFCTPFVCGAWPRTAEMTASQASATLHCSGGAVHGAGLPWTHCQECHSIVRASAARPLRDTSLRSIQSLSYTPDRG